MKTLVYLKVEAERADMEAVRPFCRFLVDLLNDLASVAVDRELRRVHTGLPVAYHDVVMEAMDEVDANFVPGESKRPRPQGEGACENN